LAKRSRPGGRRSRGGQRGRERRASSTQGRPALSVVSSPEGAAAAETVRHQEAAEAPPSVGSGVSSRHVARDYSYVLGELRRIAITGAIIVAGLAVAAVILR
jgi:hypothetical protein